MENKKYFTDIVILGAGLTGLTIAYYLNKAKKNFIILEQKERVGGVINTVNDSGFIYEEGPNTGVISNASVANIFEELSDKCNIEIADKNVEKRYVLKNGRWNALPTGLIDAISTPLFTFKDKLSLLKEPFCRPGKNPDEDLASLVKRRMGISFLNYAIDPFILGVYAGDPSKLITKYAFPKLYNLEQKYGSFIGGSIKRMFEKKSPDEKKNHQKSFFLYKRTILFDKCFT
ncbi:MAG: protoporphyrinogen oxidase [Bacteroidota bacterium]